MSFKHKYRISSCSLVCHTHNYKYQLEIYLISICIIFITTLNVNKCKFKTTHNKENKSVKCLHYHQMAQNYSYSSYKKFF